MDGTAEMVKSMEELLQGMEEQRKLPEGFRITSCFDADRTNSTSMHISGLACDVTWDGINSQTAQSFVQTLRSIKPNLSTIIEYNNDSRYPGASWPRQTNPKEPGGIHIALKPNPTDLTGLPGK